MPSSVLSLRANALSFSFDEARPLFHDVSFQLGPGFTAVVGENGAGKSTLLRLLAGELSPTAGAVELKPPSARVEFTRQQASHTPVDPQVLYDEPKGYAVLGRLGLDEEQLQRWPTLSEGERRRWQLALALISAPDVWLLDEPSNHLDAHGRQWLLDALSRYRGIGVVVSHDRQLLDALTQATLRLDGGTARLWPGPYSEAKVSWELQAQAQADARERAVAQRDKLTEQLAVARREHQSAERQRHTSARMRNRHDTDARGMGSQNLADWAAGHAGRQVEVARRAVDRAEEAVAQLPISKAVGRDDVWFIDEVAPKARLLSFVAPHGVQGGERRLLHEVSLTIERGEHVHVAGPNGAGKSSLLRALLEHSQLPPERVVYLPQEATAEREGQAMLRELKSMPKAELGRALSLVAALGLRPEQLLSTKLPSPGELRKASLALAAARRAWLLVLDEPTNHLDLPSIERLEHALSTWPGALLLVTHDVALAKACCRTTWRLAEGRVHVEAT